MIESKSNEDLPLGLGMALAQNLTAMSHFSSMNENEQHKIIEEAKQVSSRSEMRALVDRLATF